MAERPAFEDPLVRDLRAVGRSIAYPPTPELSPFLVARLEAGRVPAPQRRRLAAPSWSRRRVIVLVSAGLLVLLVAAFAARLVLGAAEIRVRTGATPSGPPLRPGSLGEPAALAEVEAALGVTLRLPPGPPPDAAYLFATPAGEAALLAWARGDGRPSLPGTPWGLVLIQVAGPEDVLVKDVGRFEDAREVLVDGRRAFWIETPHELHVVTDEGSETFLVRGSVLIWARGAVTYRIETTLPLAEAIALAGSLR